ncbi:MAG TPA: type II toxin-antitoxin system RelE/ParE family toxin [Thermoanaerobaculia bacterium]|nr:type II toxin-antitoxin system RelE/ParE family toxin [Thermoanaerobaculia bacterium]
MTAPLRLFAEAAEEIEHERNWYRVRSESAEASFLRELDHAISAVLEAPNMWPLHAAGTRRYVFPTFPFSLIYFIEDEVVFVVSLASEHKPPGYWRDRLRSRRR